MLRYIARKSARADQVLSRFLFKRYALPTTLLRDLIPGVDSCDIMFRRLPDDTWTTPLADQFVLSKIAACSRPAAILEVGTFRGFTTELMLMNTPQTTRVVSVDVSTEPTRVCLDAWSNRFEQRLGTLQSLSCAGYPRFDFVFIDADHQFASVKKDTEAVLKLVAQRALIVWHDYKAWGIASQRNGVPRYLSTLSRSTELRHIAHSSLVALEIGR